MISLETNTLRSLIFGLSSSLLLTACGSSNDSTSETTTSQIENGSLELAITDAEEDFLTYQIELDAITLNRQDGTEVSILPLSSEIDFVQYQELSELFAVLSVPRGVYTSITLSLDYTDADIVIQDEEGVSYQASAVNALGEALAEIEVELTLNDDRPIHISPIKTAQLTLDLDLAASNTIESFEPAVVSVEPFMIGTTELTEGREHRVRGLLNNASADEQSITLDVRPMRLKKGEFGEFSLFVNDDTLYEIDGVELSGPDGMALMGSLESGLPIVAYGAANTEINNRYLATKVLAGSSVPWSDDDVVKGVITSRAGNVLTINGAVLEVDERKGSFRESIEVTVGENSTVTGYRLGDSDISNLSIGQKIIAVGDFVIEDGSFDASEGNIRMKLNRIVGEVAQTSPLQIDLSHINKRPVDVFDFAGTGTDSANDADPANYEIESSSLDISSVELDEWLQVRGYPSAFGAAPQDFDALSIVNPDFSSHPAKFHARWRKDDTQNITTENSVLNLHNTEGQSKLHLVGVPGSSKLNMELMTISGNSEPGIYGLLIRGSSIQMHTDFDDFMTVVTAELGEGKEARHLTASGSYSDDEHVLSARVITLAMSAPETD